MAGLSVLSLGIVAFVFIPSVYQIVTSFRIDSGEYVVVNNFQTFKDKLIYVFPMGIPLVFTIKQLFVKKDKKYNIFLGILLVYLLLTLFVEPINALWHTGAHSGLPFRHCFIINFVLIYGSLHYLDKNYSNNFQI